MKKVITIEKRGMPVTGEGYLIQIFYYIRINDGARDEWLVLDEETFNALMRYLKEYSK